MSRHAGRGNYHLAMGRRSAWAGVVLGAGLLGCASTSDSHGGQLPAPSRARTAEVDAPGSVRLPNGEIPADLFDEWMRQGPGAVLSRIPLEPVRNERGKFIAFQIGALLAPFDGPSVGLRVGDQIVSINEKRLVNPADLFSVWQSVQERREIEADIIREGKKLELRWRVPAP